jgi:hypothetical protein
VGAIYRTHPAFAEMLFHTIVIYLLTDEIDHEFNR